MTEELLPFCECGECELRVTKKGNKFRSGHNKSNLGGGIDLPDDIIIQSYLSGMSILGLSKQYKCSETTIRNRLDKNGITLRTVKELKRKGFDSPRYLTLPIDSICDEYLSGLTPKQISNKYNCTEPTIIARLKESGIKLRSASESHIGKFLGLENPNYFGLNDEEVIRDYLGGDSPNKIADKFGCQADTIRRHLASNGVELRSSPSESLIGLSRTSAQRKNMSAAQQKVDIEDWSGFRYDTDDRKHPDVAEWKYSVFVRDNFTCQQCGSKKPLQVHHIYMWAKYPELRLDIDNGITLCKDFHKQVRGYEDDYIDMFIMLMN